MKNKTLLIVMNSFIMATGQLGGPILGRLYFLRGGTMKWLSAFLLTAGFPILMLPIAISYAIRKRSPAGGGLLLVTRWLVAASAVVGFLVALCSYLYNFGVSYLPVSVTSLLSASQLAFTAVFAYVLVKQRFTHYSVNAVVLMTLGSVVLGLHMDGDRPSGESAGKYTLGFIMTLVAAALHGFMMTAVEYVHRKSGVVVTYDLVMQMQFLISMFSTIFCILAMSINKDFQRIPREAKEFELGEKKYYMIIGSAAILLQLMVMGGLGLIFCSTSLLAGIMTSLLVPLQQVFAVFFLPESFNADKCTALALCLWGFTSYFYGEFKQSRKKPLEKPESDQPHHDASP